MALKRRREDRHGSFSGNRVERAIIDVGSNTVRLVLYGGAPRAPVTLFNEKVVARLGREIATTGKLAPDAMEQALRGLRRYHLLLRELGVDRVELVATAAARDASNGAEFLSRIAKIGFEPRLLSGEEEARLSAMGIVGAFPRASGIAADLGGGSLELVELEAGVVGKGITLPLGTLRLAEYRRPVAAKSRAALLKTLKPAGKLGPRGEALYLVGGAWRAMAVVGIVERDWPLSDPHGFTLSADSARKLARRIADTTDKALLALPRISAMRAASLPDAGNLLGALIEKIEPSEVIFSSWGLREGLLFDGLPDYARAQDPLLAGVGEFAALRGAPPQLAAQVAAWTSGALLHNAGGSERVRLAATMLALAAMQIEPNFRTGLSMEWALHKRWIAVAPHERAMMAACLAANGARLDLPGELLRLASDDQLAEAICWGLAIRLCRRLGARAQGLFRTSRLKVVGEALVLSIDASHADLFGAPNEKDLEQLAAHMGLEPQFKIVPDEVIVAEMAQGLPE